MKIKKIFDDFNPPKIKDNKVFIGKTDGMYAYNIEKDEPEFCFAYKSGGMWYIIYKKFLILQNQQAAWGLKSEGNNVKILKFSEDDPLVNYTYNILLTHLFIDEDYLLSTYEQNNQEFYLLFNPFTKEKKWEVTFDINYIENILECNDKFFVLLANKFQLLCHSSQTGEPLWSFDVNPYLMKDIPSQDNGEPIFDPKIEEVLYNRICNTLVVELSPDKLLALDASTGVLCWTTEIPDTIQWVIDEKTGDIYMTETIYNDLSSGCVYRVIEGKTGVNLLYEDLTELFGTKYPSGVTRHLEYHHFAGYKDDSVYLSFFGDGELYKLNKHTGALEESYIHDRNFESQPIIYKNRLFLTDPAGEVETKLLVFEI